MTESTDFDRLDSPANRIARRAILAAAAAGTVLALLIAFVLSPHDLTVPSLVATDSAVTTERLFQINLLSIFQSDNPFSWGFYFSLLIPLICLLISLYNAMRLRPPLSGPLAGRYDFQANIYQRFESLLVARGKIEKEQMMAYHAQYSWGAYAATAMAAMFISLPILILEASRLHPFQQSVLGWGTLLMAMAATCLAAVDLMHKNSQTPLLPNPSRFRLINISVTLGGLGILVMLAAILVFLNLLSQVLTFIFGFVALYIFSLTVLKRSVPFSELEEAFELEHGELARYMLGQEPDPTKGAKPSCDT